MLNSRSSLSRAVPGTGSGSSRGVSVILPFPLAARRSRAASSARIRFSPLGFSNGVSPTSSLLRSSAAAVAIVGTKRETEKGVKSRNVNEFPEFVLLFFALSMKQARESHHER